MRDQTQKRERSGYRLRNVLTGAAGFGAGAVALMMVMMPIASAGIAHPNGFAGSVWTANGSQYFDGCAGAKAKHITWSTVTGAAHWLGNAHSNTCTAVHGGSSTYSSADAYGSANIQVPLHLKSVNTGADVTWTINVASTTAAGTIGSTLCPVTTYSYSYYYNNSWFVYNYSTGNYSYVSTWLNYTDIYSSCAAEASVIVYAYADYIYDATTGTYLYPSSYPSNYYTSNTSGSYQYSSAYWENFSNPMITGYSGSYSYGYNYGTPGTLGSAYTVQWNFTGSFTTGDRYILYTFVENGVNAYTYGFAHGHAKASLNAKTLGHYEGLSVLLV